MQRKAHESINNLKTTGTLAIYFISVTKFLTKVQPRGVLLWPTV